MASVWETFDTTDRAASAISRSRWLRRFTRQPQRGLTISTRVKSPSRPAGPERPAVVDVPDALGAWAPLTAPPSPQGHLA